MGNQNSERLIHSYDTERRRVLCGVAEQTSSTKHTAAVTCPTCREMLRAEETAEGGGSSVMHGG
jgi:hypothetical protein